MRFSIRARIPRSITRERVFAKRETCFGGLIGLYEPKRAKNWSQKANMYRKGLTIFLGGGQWRSLEVDSDQSKARFDDLEAL